VGISTVTMESETFSTETVQEPTSGEGFVSILPSSQTESPQSYAIPDSTTPTDANDQTTFVQISTTVSGPSNPIDATTESTPLDTESSTATPLYTITASQELNIDATDQSKHVTTTAIVQQETPSQSTDATIDSKLDLETTISTTTITETDASSSDLQTTTKSDEGLVVTTTPVSSTNLPSTSISTNMSSDLTSTPILVTKTTTPIFTTSPLLTTVSSPSSTPLVSHPGSTTDVLTETSTHTQTTPSSSMGDSDDPESTAESITTHSVDGSSSRTFKDNQGVYIFLIVFTVIVIGICMFGIIGTAYQQRMRTWRPRMAYEDAYANMVTIFLYTDIMLFKLSK